MWSCNSKRKRETWRSEKIVKKKQKIRCYHLEPAGREYFQKLLEEFNRLNAGIQSILDRSPPEKS